MERIQLVELSKQGENQFCFECNEEGPTWASINLGIFLCLRCAGIHRSFGVNLSFVRSITLDRWKPKEILSMKCGGNKKAKKYLTSILSIPLTERYTNSVAENYREMILKDTIKLCGDEFQVSIEFLSRIIWKKIIFLGGYLTFKDFLHLAWTSHFFRGVIIYDDFWKSFYLEKWYLSQEQLSQVLHWYYLTLERKYCITDPDFIEKCIKLPYQTIGLWWQLDTEAPVCTRCQTKFTALNRRHHCRLCGYIFCKECSPYKGDLTWINSTKFRLQERVCFQCNEKIPIFKKVHLETGKGLSVYLVGPKNSGKKTLLSSFGSIFSSPERSIGSERTPMIRKSTVHQNGTPLLFNITMLSIENITRLKKGEADILVFLLDGSNFKSLEKIESFYQKCQIPNVGSGLILTKAELNSEIGPKHIEKLIKEKKFLFFLETSAIKRWNTEDLLSKLATTF